METSHKTMHYKRWFFKSNPLSPNSFPVNHAPIRLAHSAVSLGVVCVCAAGVCHFWGNVFGPEPASWQLPLCVVTTRSWRFHQETRAQVWTKRRTRLCSCTHTHTRTLLNTKQICIIMLLTLPLGLPSHAGPRNTWWVRRCVRTEHIYIECTLPYSTYVIT